MLAGLPVQPDAVAKLADTVRATGADELADRLDHALAGDTKILALDSSPRPRLQPRCRGREGSVSGHAS